MNSTIINGKRSRIFLIFSFLAILYFPVYAGSDPLTLQTQVYLQELGYSPGQFDGIFGSQTQNALKNFQRDNHLLITGKADEQTLKIILQSIPKEVNGSKLSLSEVVSIRYIRHEIHSAFNDGVIMPKKGMKFAIVSTGVDNTKYRNIEINLDLIVAVDHNGNIYKSKAYSPFIDAYFANTYYSNFNGIYRNAISKIPVPVLIFNKNILRAIGITKNSSLTFRNIFEIPESSLLKTILWYRQSYAVAENTENERQVLLPENGAIYMYLDRERVAPLQIVTKGKKAHYLVKLSEWDSDKDVQAIFIRAGEKVNVKVPLGSYRLKYAAGQTWLAGTELFGDETIYKKAKKRFNFAVKGREVSGYKVELILQSGGNLPTQKIPKTEW